MIRSHVLYPTELRVHKGLKRYKRIYGMALAGVKRAFGQPGAGAEAFARGAFRQASAREVAGACACDQFGARDLDADGAPLAVARARTG